MSDSMLWQGDTDPNQCNKQGTFFLFVFFTETQENGKYFKIFVK